MCNVCVCDWHMIRIAESEIDGENPNLAYLNEVWTYLSLKIHFHHLVLHGLLYFPPMPELHEAEIDSRILRQFQRISRISMKSQPIFIQFLLLEYFV